MKKVCHVLSGFDRDDTRIYSKQCSSLVSAGYEVIILTNDGIQNETREKIEIISCSSFQKKRAIEMLRAKHTFIKKALEINADIYQLHGPELIPLGVSLVKKNKIVFYDAHEDLPQQILEKEWIPRIFQKPFSKLTKWYLDKNLKKFNELFTVTPHIVDKLRKITGSVTLITNYPLLKKNIDFDFNDYKKRENIICYSGTVYHKSNQENILDAISNIEDVKYHIAGTIDNNYLIKLSGFKSWNKVKYIGRLEKNEVKHFYQTAIAGIIVFDYLPNLGYKRGTLGSNKLFEYMEAGLPIVCTDFELWKEIIDKYECGIYVQPNNAKQIEDAIRFLINNKEKAYQMGQNSKKAVLKEFNWKTQEKKYIEVFRKYDN